ncbi:MAG: hypothetical protein QNK37_02380 [Acidobacteriota bacterium]|nr:hypothetical protein [Acidobacteriota bacterium]
MELEKPNRLAARVTESLETLIAHDLNALRTDLIHAVDDPAVDLPTFTEKAIAFWNRYLDVDRIFVCDMRSGEVAAGWNKGKNIVRLQDWDDHYVPLENDEVLQKALEGDELIAAPVEGEGADMAFSLPLDDGRVWLVAFDDTGSAREFSALDMAWVNLVRDLMVIKSRLQVSIQ